MSARARSGDDLAVDLSALVKAYDVRGTVPDQLDESISRAIGAAFVDVTGAQKIVTAHDMRDSGPGLARAFAEGALHRGASVVEAGNGRGGDTVPAVLGDEVLPALPLTIVPLYFELDGSFPNHEANPLEPKNIVDLQRAVVAEGADIGIAFDGDADRCFVVDAAGEAVPPSAITAPVAVRELAKAP